LTLLATTRKTSTTSLNGVGALSSRTFRRVFLGLPVVCVLCVCERASALPLISVSASLRGLYGAYTGDSDINPYGLGVGVRAGVTLPASLYLGGSLDFFFGETVEVANTEFSNAIFQAMGNIGYDLSLGPLMLRPFLGLGLASASSEACVGNVCSESESESEFAVAPGAEAYVGLGLLSLTGEVRYNKIFSDPSRDALVLGVGLGLSF
jgi:hypothetical protein